MGKVNNEQGFTLVEVVVTLLVVSILAIGIILIQGEVASTAVKERQQFTASRLAYANLRKYVNDSIPTWFVCGTNPQTNAQTLIDTSGKVDGLPGTVHQVVIALAPYGCGGASEGLGMPIKVESKVMYGNGQGVVHASYASY